MSKPSQHFSSREEVERWIDGCLANGMSTHLIYALIQKKMEELSKRKEYFLLKRREALVNGNTIAATELHTLMKESQQQLDWFNELTGNFTVAPPPVKERVLDPDARVQLLDQVMRSMN